MECSGPLLAAWHCIGGWGTPALDRAAIPFLVPACVPARWGGDRGQLRGGNLAGGRHAMQTGCGCRLAASRPWVPHAPRPCRAGALLNYLACLLPPDIVAARIQPLILPSEVTSAQQLGEGAAADGCSAGERGQLARMDAPLGPGAPVVSRRVCPGSGAPHP